MASPIRSSKVRATSMAEFGRLMQDMPTTSGAATTARREQIWAQVNAQRAFQGQAPLAAMDAGLQYISELERSLPSGSKPLVMHAFQAAMDVSADYAHIATDQNVENGETFRLTLLAMRQYLELYAQLAGSGPSGASGVRPIAVTYGEFEQALPLLRKWGVRIGDAPSTFERLDASRAGVIKFDDFARWVMRSQMDALASGMLLRAEAAPPPDSRGAMRELSTLALSLGADGRSGGGKKYRAGSAGRARQQSPPPMSGGSEHSKLNVRWPPPMGGSGGLGLPPRQRSPPSPGFRGGGGDDGLPPRTAKSHRRSTVPVRGKSSKFDLAERLTEVGLQQYARRLSQLGFDDVSQLLALQHSIDGPDSYRLDHFDAAFASVLDQLNLMPGHRVRMMQFFQNEARNAARAAHENMLDAANAAARDVAKAEKSKEEEVRLLKARVGELEEAVILAEQRGGGAGGGGGGGGAARRKDDVHSTLPPWAPAPWAATEAWDDEEAYERRRESAEAKARARDEAKAAEREAAEAKAKERAEAKAKRFLMRLMKRDRAKAFTQWAEATEETRHLRQMVLRWQQQELAHAFDVWCAAHEKGTGAKGADEKLKKAAGRLINRRLAMGWEQWVSVWRAAKRAKDRLSKVATRLKNPGLAKAFVRWAEMAEARGGKLKKMRRVFQQAFQSGLAKAWNSWIYYVRPMMVLRKAAKALLHSGMKRAFNAWHQATSGVGDEKQRRIDMARNVMGKLANRDLSMAWEAWKAMVQSRHDAWALMDKVTRRWLLMEASGCWHHWKTLTAELVRKERLMRSFAARLANIGVAKAWASWVARAEENRRLQIVFHRFSNQLLTRTFFAWIKFHRMQHEGFAARMARKLLEALQALVPSGGGGGGGGGSTSAPSKKKKKKAAPSAGLDDDDDDDESEDDDDIPYRDRRSLRKSAKVGPSYDVDLPPMDGPYQQLRSQAANEAGMRTGSYRYGYGAGPDRLDPTTSSAMGYIELDKPSVESTLLRSTSGRSSRVTFFKDGDTDDDGAGIGIRHSPKPALSGKASPPDGGWSGDPSSALQRSVSSRRR